MSGFVSVSEAAKIKNVTRQAIYLAIRLKRLKAFKYNEKWRVFLEDLTQYDKERYSRLRVFIDGQPLFDESKGFISIDKCSNITGIPKQKLYYAARKGTLKAVRKRSSWIVHLDDLFRFEKNLLKKELSRNQCA